MTGASPSDNSVSSADIVFVEFAADQDEDFADRVIDVEFRHVRHGASGQSADAFDEYRPPDGRP